MLAFAREFDITRETRVLDVGGTMHNWKLLEPVMRPRLTMLNIDARPADLPADVEWMQGTALALPFHPGDFDVVFSNSVIEHVGDWSAQQQFASEVRRLNASYWIQTPNRHFPIEPHYLGIGVQWLPRVLAKPYARVASLRGWMPSPGETLDDMLDSIRLLTGAEFALLFPDGGIRREHLGPLVKSFTAVRH